MSVEQISKVFKYSRSKGAARLVLLAMADEAHSSGELSAYARSQTHFMKKANLSERAVRDAIRELEKIGELTVLKVGHGREKSDYLLTVPESTPADSAGVPGEDCRAEGQILPGSGAESAAPSPRSSPVPVPFSSQNSAEHQSTDPVEVPSASSSVRVSETKEDDAEFDRWYSGYPHKVGKPAARKAFARALKGGAKVPALVQGAERWAAYWAAAGTERQFIPHPATWLNQERWDDEPPAVPALRNGRPGFAPPRPRPAAVQATDDARAEAEARYRRSVAANRARAGLGSAS